MSFDDVEANRHFAEKSKFPYRLLCDVDRTIGVAYGAAESPTAGSARRISYLIGPDGAIKAVWGKVDVSKHADEVLTHIP